MAQNSEGRPPRGVNLVDRLEGFLFRSSLHKLALVLAAVAVLKSGIWHIPNLDTYQQLAENPFAVPLPWEPGSHYLIWSWLGPFVAWVLGATGFTSFFLMHLGFSVMFTALFCWVTIRRLPEATARLALIVFFWLPVSTTAYFWVSLDSLTLLLMMVALGFPSSRAVGALAGFLLGLQHFELATVGFGALLAALVLRGSSRESLRVDVRWCLVVLAGVAAGRAALTAVFHWAEMEVLIDRSYWVGELFVHLVDMFWKYPQLILWSTLGAGWLVLIRYWELGRRALPFTLVFASLLVLCLLVDDQTRVVAVASFPLILVFWLHGDELAGLLEERFITWMTLAWLVVPWIWVWRGRPQTSVLTYGIARWLGQTTGWFEVPDGSLWPFIVVPYD